MKKIEELKNLLDFLPADKESDLKILDGRQAPVPAPRIYITQLALQKIKCFVDICKYEINGLGIVKRNNNNFTIEDVFLIKQTTDSLGMHVETDSKALNHFIYELVKNGGDASEIRFQWHSHVDMPAYFSPEDVDTIRGYMNDYMISLVMNKQGEHKCRLDLFKPFHLSLETPLFVKIPCLTENLIEEYREEMEQKVKVESLILGFPIVKKTETDIDNMNEIPIKIEDILEQGGEK